MDTHLLVRATISRNEENRNSGQFHEMKLVIDLLPSFVVEKQRIFVTSAVQGRRERNISGVHVCHNTSFQQWLVEP